MQAAFRGKQQRAAYKSRMDYLKANVDSVIKIQVQLAPTPFAVYPYPGLP